jgi:hypothetical protein
MDRTILGAEYRLSMGHTNPQSDVTRHSARQRSHKRLGYGLHWCSLTATAACSAANPNPLQASADLTRTQEGHSLGRQLTSAKQLTHHQALPQDLFSVKLLA